MTNEEMLRTCHEMEAELEAIRKRIEEYDVTMDVLQGRLDKVGEIMDKLKEDR